MDEIQLGLLVLRLVGEYLDSVLVAEVAVLRQALGFKERLRSAFLLRNQLEFLVEIGLNH